MLKNLQSCYVQKPITLTVTFLPLRSFVCLLVCLRARALLSIRKTKVYLRLHLQTDPYGQFVCNFIQRWLHWMCDEHFIFYIHSANFWKINRFHNKLCIKESVYLLNVVGSIHIIDFVRLKYLIFYFILFFNKKNSLFPSVSTVDFASCRKTSI